MTNTTPDATPAPTVAVLTEAWTFQAGGFDKLYPPNVVVVVLDPAELDDEQGGVDVQLLGEMWAARVPVDCLDVV